MATADGGARARLRRVPLLGVEGDRPARSALCTATAQSRGDLPVRARFTLAAGDATHHVRPANADPAGVGLRPPQQIVRRQAPSAIPGCLCCVGFVGHVPSIVVMPDRRQTTRFERRQHGGGCGGFGGAFLRSQTASACTSHTRQAELIGHRAADADPQCLPMRP